MRSTDCSANVSMRSCRRLRFPGLNQSLTRLRFALCCSPSIWIRVLTGVWSMAATRARGASVGTGALVNRSGRRSISIASSCLVIAQNAGKSGTDTFRIGDSSRMRFAAACQRSGSAYAAGSAKIEPRFSVEAVVM